METRTKTLKINSINDPILRKIRRPCEARGGHGCISIMIATAVLAIIAVLFAKAAKWLWGLVFGTPAAS